LDIELHGKDNFSKKIDICVSGRTVSAILNVFKLENIFIF